VAKFELGSIPIEEEGTNPNKFKTSISAFINVDCPSLIVSNSRNEFLGSFSRSSNNFAMDLMV